MRKYKNTLWIALVTVFAVTIGVSAAMSKKEAVNSVNPAARMNVTVEGELQVLESAGSGSKEEAKTLGVKVAKAMDAKGGELANLEGQTLRLTANIKAKELSSKHTSGDKLMIKGSLDADAKTLAVSDYKPASAGSKAQGSGSK